MFVSASNLGYAAETYLDVLPAEAIGEIHLAGHGVDANEARSGSSLLIDTHGAPVKGDVWSLLEAAYARFGVRPTLLERDFHFPPFAELLDEVATIRACQARHAERNRARA